MHGRLKIRTTAEEQARKKKEQWLKMLAYRTSMSKIQEKRSKGEFDDNVMCSTMTILMRNPDITTLWNIRKECLLVMAQEYADCKETFQSICEQELHFTELCLKSNHKSYSAWHHRCWTLEHSPMADWEREVEVCAKYLKMDERNFHTWDYRRYVVAKARVSKAQELEYCTEKIKVNFSNYSSWHYRSKLLPILYPYEGEARPKRPMSEDMLKDELEMVLTATFTDPGDSSAWFYQRWLLGISQPELALCAFRCDKEKAVVAFSQALHKDVFKVLLQSEDGQQQWTFDWRALSAGSIDTTWVAKVPENCALTSDDAAKYTLKVDISSNGEQQLAVKATANGYFYFCPPNTAAAYSDAVVEELKLQLKSCNDLMEYEPDSKWTLLTSALLMRAIDTREYHAQSLGHLEQLQLVDFMREGYYRDMAAKWVLEDVLLQWSHSNDIPTKLHLQEQPSVTALFYKQYMCIADEVLLSKELAERYGTANSKLMTFASIQP